MDLTALAGVGGGLLGGLFGGGQPQLPPELQAIFHFLMQSAKQARRFGNSAPLSTDQERMALAGARGQLGNELNGQRDRAMMAFGPGDEANKGDFMAGLAGIQAGNMASIDSEHLLDALNRRFQAKYQMAPGIASSATSAASGPRTSQPGLGDIFGQLAQTYAYSQARKPAGAAPAMAPPAAPPAPMMGTAPAPVVGLSGMRNNLAESLDGQPRRSPAPYGFEALRGRL